MPLVALWPRWLNPLLQRLQRKRARQLGLREALAQDLDGTPAVLQGSGLVQPLHLRSYPWAPLLGQWAFVLMRFAGFACCVWAFDLQHALDWGRWLSAFALAWTVGLVVPGAPGGLGVFESVLLLRLGTALPDPALLAVALGYRLVVTTADLLAGLMASLDGGGRPKALGTPRSGAVDPGETGTTST